VVTGRARRSRRAAVVGIGAGCALVLSLGVGAAAAGQVRSHEAAARHHKTGGKPPQPGGTQETGVVFDPVKQVAKKVKVRIKFPPLSQLVYIATHSYPDTKLAWISTVADAYVTSPKNAKSKFGVFPTQTVGMLGFGAIPVTATLHVQQTMRHGEPTPLVLRARYSGAPDSHNQFHAGRADVTGELSVRISDVRLDTRPLPVGAHCATDGPAIAHLTAPPGKFAAGRTPKYLYLPFQGGTLKGTVDIPRFHGCHDGAENLDPLFTGLISGPGNPITAVQPGSLTTYPPPLPKHR